jgi:hypothetical protein
VKSSSSMASVNRVDSSSAKGGKCGSQCRLEERPSVIKEVLNGVIVRHRRTLT